MIKAAISFAALSWADCGDGSKQLPPFADIENATLASANCINNKGRSDLAPNASVEASVTQVLQDCRELRSEAVPVMAKTISEFDDIHNGLAQYVVAEPRKKEPHAPNQ